MLSLTAFAHFTRIYALCNEGCVFGGIVLIKEAIDSYYVRMVLTYDGIDNLLTYKDDHQEVEYGYEGMWKLTRRKDARGNTTRYDYTEEMEPYREIDPEGRITGWHYDGRSN